uniref:GP5 n=1 Tax=Kibale red colobus virus 1 TaxID=1885929 RepID=A0A1L5YNR3_9NIDO|nr:GP5 [Kibale red colobus virus 1]APP93343.1 GP5 [Kibale red colobus virus 1]APP93356.1 GP5 [Kibale red colobus virus 1]APP93369.1 GP5 [Kibale red colobus virus 1]APP93382.1 GP5 [Kibale red colobus virus 1]
MYFSVLSLSILLGLSWTSVASDGGNTGVGFRNLSTFWDQLQQQIISPSYVVNISICGALSIMNDTHWFRPCTLETLSSVNHSDINKTHCYLHNVTGLNINHTALILETYLAYPLLTHLLSYSMATTAAFLDFLFFGGLAVTAYLYVSPSIFFFTPLALIFLVIFIRRIIENCLALRYAWTRHTNFILDDKGRVFVNHDDVLIGDKQGLRVGDQKIKAAAVVFRGRRAELLREAHAEEWSW